jgi:4-hydroxy-3-polyprenylbenzoate decarboxylase
MLTVLAIQQAYPGHAKQVGMAAASCHAGAYANRFVVVVDEDIDPTDTNQVLWAMCTRTDVVEDVDVMKRCWSTPLDPMAYAGEGPRYYNNRMIIDACRPFDRRETFPAVARVTEADAKQLRERWPALFEADGTARKTRAYANR